MEAEFKAANVMWENMRMVDSPKDIICNISALRCLKMTRPMYFVLTVHWHSPAECLQQCSNPEKSLILFKVTVCLIGPLPWDSQRGRKEPGNENKQDFHKTLIHHLIRETLLPQLSWIDFHQRCWLFTSKDNNSHDHTLRTSFVLIEKPLVPEIK